ncbi:hypothetical protein YDYSY3_45400 [Paenibacillus chitinolyticus]|nr:hypothetical protein YDYSY3_45400 [Paenibacillus chitinolyticus]
MSSVELHGIDFSEGGASSSISLTIASSSVSPCSSLPPGIFSLTLRNQYAPYSTLHSPPNYSFVIVLILKEEIKLSG